MAELIDQEVDARPHPDRYGLRILEQREERHVLRTPARQHLDKAALHEVMLAKEGGQVGDSKAASDGVMQ